MDGFWPFDVPDMQQQFPVATGPQGLVIDPVQFATLLNEVQRLRGATRDLSKSNSKLFEYVGDLRERVAKVEKENAELRARRSPRKKLALAIGGLDLNGGGSLPTPLSTAALTGTTLGFGSRPPTGVLAGFPNSAISSSTGSLFPIPSSAASSSALPSSMATSFKFNDADAEANASAASAFQVKPQTPTTPGGRSKLPKSEKHDLTGKLPPANVCFPLMPLTDIEVIAFFYTCSSRPIVAMRLRAKLGPAEITDVLNEFRDIKPNGYKRNTCSVHFTAALKKYDAQHGKIEYTKMADFFVDATDLQATNQARHLKEELDKTCDFPVLALFKDLKRFPANGEGGIFTECLKWCRENDANVMLSNLHLVARALLDGDDPRETLGLPDSNVVDDAHDFAPSTNDEVAQAGNNGKNPLVVDEGAIEQGGVQEASASGAATEDPMSTSELSSLSNDELDDLAIAKAKTPAKKPGVKLESPRKN